MYDNMQLHMSMVLQIQAIMASCHFHIKMAFFISPMGSFQRGMQLVKNWYGGQLDASLDSGSGTKSPLKILE